MDGTRTGSLSGGQQLGLDSFGEAHGPDLSEVVTGQAKLDSGHPFVVLAITTISVRSRVPATSVVVYEVRCGRRTARTKPPARWSSCRGVRAVAGLVCLPAGLTGVTVGESAAGDAARRVSHDRRLDRLTGDVTMT